MGGQWLGGRAVAGYVAGCWEDIEEVGRWLGQWLNGWELGSFNDTHLTHAHTRAHWSPHKTHRHTHTHTMPRLAPQMFDAIVGDPPYGVRAGGKKSAFREIEIRNRETHIPGTAPYSLGECLRDLLDYAARTLRVGGRLVYFLPATPETYKEEEVPTHPALELLYNT